MNSKLERWADRIYWLFCGFAMCLKIRGEVTLFECWGIMIVSAIVVFGLAYSVSLLIDRIKERRNPSA